MSTESMMKRAEKLAALLNRRAEILHELKEVDEEIDRVQQWGVCEGDHRQGPDRQDSIESR